MHRPRAVRAPSARPPLVVCAPFIVSTSCPLVLRASSASCPRVLCTPCASCSHVLRAPSASSLRVLRTPFASYLLVLCALRVVRPPYVALSHKTKLKRVPSNWYNFLSLSQELFLLLCSGFCWIGKFRLVLQLYISLHNKLHIHLLLKILYLLYVDIPMALQLLNCSEIFVLPWKITIDCYSWFVILFLVCMSILSSCIRIYFPLCSCILIIPHL